MANLGYCHSQLVETGYAMTYNISLRVHFILEVDEYIKIKDNVMSINLSVIVIYYILYIKKLI